MEGLQKVQLKCGADSMQVELLTKDEFSGVMYTRGSFYKQKEPCFVKPKALRGTRSLKMNFKVRVDLLILEILNLFLNLNTVQSMPNASRGRSILKYRSGATRS